jgi:hypothetical protein
MSGVNSLLQNVGERLGKDFTGTAKKDSRPVQDWINLKETAIQVGANQLRYLVQRKGRNYRQGFVDATNRPTTLYGDAESLLAAQEDITTAIVGGFNCIAADKAEHVAKQGARKEFGGQPEVRHTGKTERERLKRVGKNKA